MGLTEDSRAYLGRELLIEPFYGWGWSRHDSTLPPLTYDEMSGPAPFHATITGFFEDDGELLGGTALIGEPGHAHDTQHVVFSVRHVGVFDFCSRQDAFNLAIGPELQVGDRPRVTGPGSLSGFGRVRDEHWAAASDATCT